MLSRRATSATREARRKRRVRGHSPNASTRNSIPAASGSDQPRRNHAATRRRIAVAGFRNHRMLHARASQRRSNAPRPITLQPGKTAHRRANREGQQVAFGTSHGHSISASYVRNLNRPERHAQLRGNSSRQTTHAANRAAHVAIPQTKNKSPRVTTNARPPAHAGNRVLPSNLRRDDRKEDARSHVTDDDSRIYRARNRRRVTRRNENTVVTSEATAKAARG